MLDNFSVNLVLLVLLFICLYTDLTKRKIYNKVTITFIVIAFLINTYLMDLPGILFTFKGLALGFLLTLIPFAQRGIGGGDVKLIMAVGALKGAGFVFYATLATYLIGGIVALLILLTKKRKESFPYGIAIFTGTLVSLLVV